MDVANVARTPQTTAPYSVEKKKSGNNQDVSMQDFFTLLAAQLKNQNMMNPVGDTEFLSQMAQFSALSATQQLNASFSNFMAVNYVGKNVKAYHTNAAGEQKIIEGIADSVEFYGGKTYISIKDTKVSPEDVIEVSIAKTNKPEEPPEVPQVVPPEDVAENSIKNNL